MVSISLVFKIGKQKTTWCFQGFWEETRWIAIKSEGLPKIDVRKKSRAARTRRVTAGGRRAQQQGAAAPRTTLPTMQRGASCCSLVSHEDYISQKAPRGRRFLGLDGALRALPAGNGSPRGGRCARWRHEAAPRGGRGCLRRGRGAQLRRQGRPRRGERAGPRPRHVRLPQLCRGRAPLGLHAALCAER